MVYVVVFNMNSSSHIFSLIKYGIIPAVAYSIPVLFFLRDDTFSMTWLLYLGNALFLACIFITAIINNKITGPGAAIARNGFMITIVAVIISVIIIGIMLVFFLGGTHINAVSPATRLPAAAGRKTIGSLVFMLLADVLLGNFIAGIFAALFARSTTEKNSVAS